MQMPTHQIVGIFIQLLLFSFVPVQTDVEFLILIGLIAVFCFFSHFFVDAFALITYHPPERQNTNFWKYWHIFIYISVFIFGVFFFLPFAFGMFFAILVDLWDWVLLRKYLKKPPQLHWIADKIRSPLRRILPDLSYNRFGILPELALYILVYLYITFQIFDFITITLLG